MGSRLTNGAESKYIPQSKETRRHALAVADILDKERLFVLGWKNPIIAVDHQLLLSYLIYLVTDLLTTSA